MKTTQEWIKWHEANPDVSDEQLNEHIQLDALEHATSLLTVNADSPTRGFNAICRLVNKLIKKQKRGRDA